MNVFVMDMSIKAIKLYLDYKFNKKEMHNILNSLKFIEMDIDKIGFFAKFEVDYNFPDEVFSSPIISASDGDIELSFILFIKDSVITVEGVTATGEVYNFDKYLDLRIQA